MSDISVTPSGRGAGDYDVRVDAGGRRASFQVTVPPGLSQELGGADPETLVRASFEFLLEREPVTSILSTFSLDVIGRYFPEYHREMRARFG